MPKTEQLHIRISPERLEFLRNMSKEMGVPVSKLVHEGLGWLERVSQSDETKRALKKRMCGQ